MTSRDVPAWVSVSHGSSPILLVAPHGGRRHDLRIPGQHKVNDLLTADVTRELAAACGASTIINEQVDRNVLDLNRVSQVRRDAPWMIPLMAEMLGGMLAGAERAVVLMVHGWNVTQAACDVGIGMREHPEGVAPVRADSATVSPAFLASCLQPLQHAAAADGIAVTIGSRYPAAHPNNLLQIFRAVADRDAELPCPVAALCREGRIEAAQLELAIPLRWPGPRRERFLTLLSATFGTRGARAPTPRAVGARVLRAVGGRVTGRRGIQLVAGDMLLMASIDAGEAGPIGGRLVVSQDRDRLALFTGEVADAACAWTVPPLVIEASTDGGMQVRYDGPLVDFASLTPFLDLEQGLASGRLVEGEVDLTFVPEPSASEVEPAAAAECFGEVRGHVVVAGRSHEIATRGVGTNAIGSGIPTLPSCRITLADGPWGAVMLGVRREARPTWSGDGSSRGVLVGLVSWKDVRVQCRIHLAGATGDLELVGDGARLDATLERLIPVRRPGRDGAVVETTFALVRAADAYVGWVEISVVIVPEMRAEPRELTRA